MFPGKNRVSNFPNIPKKGNRYSGRGSTKGSKVDKPTSRHITKMAKVKERILKAAREKQSVTRQALQGCQLISLQKLCRLEGSGNDIFKVQKAETCNLGYFTQ